MAQSYIFFLLALKWNQIMKFWYKKEEVFLHEPYKVSGISLTLKVRLVGCIFFFFFLCKKCRFCNEILEHFHSIFSGTFYVYRNGNTR